MSVPSWARKGVRVVCVKKGKWALVTGTPGSARDRSHPVNGETYTIAEVDADWEPICIRLREFCDLYNIQDFRPLVPRKTQAEDVAKVSHWLTQPVPSNAKERVGGVDA